MTLRHLNIFIHVFQEKNMTAAAKKLFIKQPSVSQAIAELEAHYGFKLFNRIGNRLYITKDGETLYQYALEINERMGKIEGIAKQNLPEITVRIGASITIGETFFPELVKQFTSEHTDYKVISYVNNVNNIIQMVAGNTLDFGILAAASVKSAEVECRALFKDQLVLVYNTQHPIKNKKSISPEEIFRHPLIVREKGSSIREAIDKQNIPMQMVGEYTSFSAIIKAVRLNLGVSVLPKAFADNHRSSKIRYIEIDHPDFKRDYWLIEKKRPEEQMLYRSFYQYCLDYSQFRSTT